jgi:hypothetical protein
LEASFVVASGVFLRAEDHGANKLITNEQKTALGALHLRTIDLVDRVLVVNPGGYIGESTSREIAYARATGKPISFTDPVRRVDAAWWLGPDLQRHGLADSPSRFGALVELVCDHDK